MAEEARLKKIKEEAIIEHIDIMHLPEHVITVQVVLEDKRLLLETHRFVKEEHLQPRLAMLYRPTPLTFQTTRRIELEC